MEEATENTISDIEANIAKTYLYSIEKRIEIITNLFTGKLELFQTIYTTIQEEAQKGQLRDKIRIDQETLAGIVRENISFAPLQQNEKAEYYLPDMKNLFNFLLTLNCCIFSYQKIQQNLQQYGFTITANIEILQNISIDVFRIFFDLFQSLNKLQFIELDQHHTLDIETHFVMYLITQYLLESAKKIKGWKAEELKSVTSVYQLIIVETFSRISFMHIHLLNNSKNYTFKNKESYTQFLKPVMTT